MKTAVTWILLILLALGGIGGSYALSEALRTDARDAWEAEASRAAQWLSGTVLGWLEESYSPLSGLAILFENSREVTEVEFLGAADALEARATAFFLDAKAVARPRADGEEWSIEFSNDPLGPLSPDTPLSRHPVILETIKVAVDNPDLIMLGPPFSGEDGSRHSAAALAIEDAHGPLVVIGLVNYDAIVKGLFDIHKLDGLQIQIQGRFKESGGPGDQLEVIGKSIPDALYSETTRTVSAGADLSLTWYVTQQFSDGPQEALADFTFMGGIGGTILIVLFIGMLLRRNQTITKRVEEATDELAESRERLDLALASSGIGTWDRDFANDTIFFDEAHRRILGTDPSEGELTWASFIEIIHPEDAQKVESAMRKALAGGEDYVSEFRYLRPNGEVRILQVHGHVIRDEAGQPLRMIGTSTDITDRKQAEEALKKLSRAVEQSPASVVITNIEGTIEYVNPKFCDLTGYTAEEAIGQNPRILKSGQTPPEVYEKLWKTLAAGGEWRGELLNKKKNGELYWEAVSISAIRSGDGSVSHYLAVKEDITERKQMEKSIREKEARFRGYFEQSHVGMAVTSPSKGWVEANDQLLGMLGYTLEELRQKSWGELTHPQDLDADMKQFERMLAGEIDNYSLDKRFVRKDGEIVYTNLNVSCTRNELGDVVNVLASLLDITERKNIEEDLQARFKDLDEAQSAMLNMMEDLDEEKAKAEAATRAKGDFLANMSHEIRTPMNAVIGMSHLALKTELTNKQQDYLTKIQSSANALLGIINDILDFSKIEAGKLDMESVEFGLDDVLDNLANLVTVKAQEKEDLEVLFATGQDVPRFLVGDPLRLGQVLINLSNNAVKFTDSGEIVVSTGLVNKDNGSVTLKFSVRDSGIGLSQEQVGRLFEAFSQADTSTTRQYGGTGLGLTISKRLVELMGGEIWVESEPGQGSTFSFTANFGLGKDEARKPFVPSPDLRGTRVLVVDDNATSRTILQDLLESFSFDVTLAASGEEGLSELESASEDRPFDLVVMDWKMPGMDGLEASRRIKSLDLPTRPPIILVTAYGREELMQQADEIGLEGFLLKPVNPSVLFDTIMQAFGREISGESRAAREQEGDAGALEELAGARVLLAEDNEINQQVAREILEGVGLNVSIANDGEEALQAVQKSSFDAVLMDIQMPVMDGHEATIEIRKDDRFKALPIIAMTAHAMAGDMEKSLKAGMNDHVTKPIDPEQLFAALRKWIPAKKGREGDRRVEARPRPPSGAKPSEALPFPESLPGFDLAAGLKRLQGNKSLYKKLLGRLAADYSEAAGDIREALKTGDMDRAHQLVHSLKGVAGNLAAKDLAAAATGVEKLVKGAEKDEAPSPDVFEPKLAALEMALNEALESVQTLGPAAADQPAEASAEPASSVAAGLGRDVAERIRNAAEIGDVTQLTAIADELKSQSDAVTPFCDKIIQLATNFDFDGIINLVSDI